MSVRTHAPKLGGVLTKTTRASNGIRLSKKSDSEELEADRVANAVVSKNHFPSWSFARTNIGSPRDASASRDHVERDGVKTTLTKTADLGTPHAASLVEEGLRSASTPLDRSTRNYMESRFGHDFSRVKIHAGTEAASSARDVNARAYTIGNDVVFGKGEYAPQSASGRRLLAHELTHVVQQSENAARMGGTLWREEAKSDPKAQAEDFVDQFGLFPTMNYRPEDVAHQLFTRFISSRLDYGFVREVIKKFADYNWDDNIASNFVVLIGPDLLAQIGRSSNGRLMLDVLYEAMITGSVSDFERKQANRILLAKMKNLSPEDFIKSTKLNASGRPTQIFPVRNMGISRGDDSTAPLMAELRQDGKVRANYPTRVLHAKMFASETRTLAYETFLTDGQILNPNEIVGIKDYESGGKVSYLPALALIDYSNRVEKHTLGTIADVVMTTATLGGGAAVSGTGRAAVWAARLAFLDKMATVVHVVSVLVNEHRDWIVEKLGTSGEYLIRAVDVADAAAGIYGIGRLGHAAFEIARNLRAASQAARAKAAELGNLDANELGAIEKIESETNQFAQEMEKAEAEAQAEASAATKTEEAKPPTQPKPAEPTQPHHAESQPHSKPPKAPEPLPHSAKPEAPKTAKTHSTAAKGKAKASSTKKAAKQKGVASERQHGSAETPKKETPSPAHHTTTPPKGEEVFQEITQELGLEPRGNAPSGGVRQGAADARAAGFVGPHGQPGKVDLAIQPHGSAPTARSELGVTGSQAQSAHVGPTSALRDVPGYSRSGAQTTLLNPQTHAAFDNYWKNWAQNMRRTGRTTCTANELYNVMLEAVDQIPNMEQRTKGALSFRLHQEIFAELGLRPDSIINLPYPNITP